MELSQDIERVLNEFDEKFTARDPENGLPTYTQHPAALRNWFASRLHSFETAAKLPNGHDTTKHKCTVGCPAYSSGHSIDANGNCNMGCC